jgi:citrate synthase
MHADDHDLHWAAWQYSCMFTACRMCSGVDVYTAMAAGVGALHGPLHGGASEAVVGMLQAIGKPDNVPRFLQQVSYSTPHKMGVLRYSL